MFMDSPRANPPPYYSHGDNLKRFWCKYSTKIVICHLTIAKFDYLCSTRSGDRPGAFKIDGI